MTSNTLYKARSLGVTLSRPGSFALWCAWHVVGILALLLVPATLKLNLGFDSRPMMVGLIVSYCATVIMLTFYSRGGRAIRFAELALASALMFGSFFLFLLLSRFEYSASALSFSLTMIAGFLFLPLALKDGLQKTALSLVILPIVVAAVNRGSDKGTSLVLTVENKLIRTSLYRLVARYYRNFAREEATGGALAQFGDRYLLATGEGDLHLFSWDPATKQLDKRKLSVRVPINRDEFIRDAAPRKVYTGAFRTADILVQDFGDHFRLFASHHHWNPQEKCFTVRVSAINGAYRDFANTPQSAKWETVYDSVPCLHFKNKKDPFGGEQIGGKMVLLDEHRLLLTVGDQMYDGVESSEILPQDKTAHYGKTILVDLETRQASIYSMGHRNGQGLAVDATGNIWETEHGPQGGDELNEIEEGKNYGWPFVTYGRNYGQLTWPLNPKQGRHEGYEMPAYTWIPSIGTSALTSVKGGLFEDWKDDLLVAALGDGSIRRVRTDRGRTVLTEAFNVRERIRDVMQDANGRLILFTEASPLPPTQTAIVVIEPVVAENTNAMLGLSTVERGELIFDQCGGCHRVEDGQSHGIGPDLKGVFGRRAATAKGYSYSDAMKGFAATWNAKTLDAFIANPAGLIPGTAMDFDGTLDPAERASLIEYLKSQK